MVEMHFDYVNHVDSIRIENTNYICHSLQSHERLTHDNVSIYDDRITVLVVLTIRCGTEDSYSGRWGSESWQPSRWNPVTRYIHHRVPSCMISNSTSPSRCISLDWNNCTSPAWNMPRPRFSGQCYVKCPRYRYVQSSTSTKEKKIRSV